MHRYTVREVQRLRVWHGLEQPEADADLENVRRIDGRPWGEPPEGWESLPMEG